jgi:coenzyme F420-reducing hydrogenase beta subunit
METINLYEKLEECCGCEICSNVCPQGIIKMKPDGEGFFYPIIIEENKCINCKKCLQYCPVKNVSNYKSKTLGYYAGSFESEETKSCASGGAATAISCKILDRGGVVYGVSYSSNYESISYIKVEKRDALEKLKGSKYAQARKFNIYKEVKQDLREKKEVLFIGLPCEVAAVKEYCLGVDENLYTVELICHGPTSLLIQKEYCNRIKHLYKEDIKEFSVRYKKNGKWKPYYIRAKMKNGEEHIQEFHKSDYGIAFRYLKRPSCNVCKIKDGKFQGDITIGDYHAASNGMKGYNENGVSVLLPHTIKGKFLMELKEERFNIVEIDRHSALLNQAISQAIPAKRYRKKFSKVLQKKGLVIAASRLEVVFFDSIVLFKNRLLGYGSFIKKKLTRGRSRNL